MHVVDLDFVFDSHITLECIGEEVEIQDLAPLDDSTNHYFHLLVLELVEKSLTMWHLTKVHNDECQGYGWILVGQR